MCQGWLKYVAPMMADATRIDGQLSVDLAHAKIPVTEPKAGNVAGVVAVHRAQLRPGPLADQFLVPAAEIKSLLGKQAFNGEPLGGGRAFMTVDNQNIEFQMVEGRVYHRNMQIAVQDVIITTNGSVGFDQSIDMVAQIPLRDQWFSDTGVLRGLKGQVIQVPIKGTLEKPSLEKGAIRELAKKLITGGAQAVASGRGDSRLG